MKYEQLKATLESNQLLEILISLMTNSLDIEEVQQPCFENLHEVQEID